MDPKDIFVPESLGGEPPEKYIRTFERDVDVFQRGGTPGLAPLKTPTSKPSERLIEASPNISAPKPASSVTPEVEQLQVIPEPPTVDVLSKKAEPEPEVAPLKTYSQDFRDHLKETNASTATVLAAEQDAGPSTAATVETPEPPSHTSWYVAGGIALLIVGGIGMYVAYSKYLAAHMPVIVAPANTAPIFVDSTEQISGAQNALLQSIVQSVSQMLPPNTVRELSFDIPTGKNILTALGIAAPGILTRNTNTTGNMVGIVHTSAGQSPFFILSVESYSATFSGMLSWETAMQHDMRTLFALYPAPSAPIAPVVATTTATTTTKTAVATTTASTATTTQSAPAAKQGFRDEVVSNHDVRVYRDALGRSILLYGYWSPNVLVIARDPASFIEIVGRLATSHTK